MADEGYINTGFPVEIGLKGENHGHSVHDLLDLPDSSSSPRPHLGTDIVKYLYAIFLRRLRERKVEIRVINEDDKIGSVFLQ